jgi:glutamate dehydrogenase (NAD(P)+)
MDMKAKRAALSSSLRKAASGIVGFDGADAIADSDFWEVRSEVLVPAALEGQLTEQRARTLHTRLVVEGANGPTTPAADGILHDRAIVVVPDVLANAGGVIVSYFEWVQDHSSWFWTEEEIGERLDRILRRAFDDVWVRHEALGVSLRTAAFVVGCSRVLQAREQRGLYP